MSMFGLRGGRRRLPVLVGIMGAASLLVAGCSSTGGDAGASSTADESAATETTAAETTAAEPATGESADAGSTASYTSDSAYTIYVSNNYIGNPWRIQMENQIKALAKRDFPNVKLNIVNSDNTVTAQTASLQTILRQKPDGILIDSASATGLNTTIQSACDQGSVVFSFDQVATADCAYLVRQDDYAQAANMAEYVAAKIGFKGDVLIDTGIPGAPASATRTKAYQETFAKYKDINVAGTYVGNGAPGPELQQVSSLLASQRNVVGVVTEGYCSAIFQAFDRAGLPIPVCAGMDTADSAKTCMDQKMQCYLWATPSWVGAYALRAMIQQLDTGKEAPKIDSTYENEYFVTEPFEFDADTLEQVQLEAGVNYFPDADDSLILTVDGAGLGLTVDNALTGS